MGKTGSSNTIETPEIPEELKPLLMQTVDAWMQFQQGALGGMMGPGYTPGAGVQPYVDTANGDGVWGRFFHNLGYGPGKTGDATAGSGAQTGQQTGVVTDGEASYPPLPDGMGWQVPGSVETGANDHSFGGAWNAAGNWVPSAVWQEPENIFGNAARPVIGPSELESWAAGLVPQLTQKPGELLQAEDVLSQMGDVSRRKVTGEGMTDDPAYAAAIRAYDQAMRPIVENQAALAGLGRSTALTNAAAAGQAQYIMPTVQDFLGRQERGIDRELGALGQQFQGYTGLGDRATDRLRTAIGTGMEVGGIGRGMTQDWADSQYNDWLRRAALFEQAIGGPLGMVPSTIGSTATSNTSKK
jgi:hypothetical protein